MQTLGDLKRAIAQLPAKQRAHILTWLSDATDGDGVGEAAPSHRSDSDYRHFSLEEYFALEEASPIMSGASENHEFISGNLFAAIHTHLRGKECAPYKDDFKLRLQFAHNEIFYYRTSWSPARGRVWRKTSSVSRP